MIDRLAFALALTAWIADKILSLILFAVLSRLDRWSRGKP